MKNGTHVNITHSGQKDLHYIRVSAGKQRGEYVHRMIAAALLRRPLLPWEQVDHKDQDETNNAPWNLRVLSLSDHSKVTNNRRYNGNDGVEGVDYTVILDGEEIFNRESGTEQKEVRGTEVETLNASNL